MAGEMRRIAVLAALALLAAAPAAQAIPHLPPDPAPVAGNPADRMLEVPIEESVYDPATHCTPHARRPGMVALQGWLEANARGVSWGTYRCERWGKDSASLHAEGRALDWHLDRSNPADTREAQRLIRLLLAPDQAGNPQALARRMGLEEIIWDCGYWGAGMPDFRPYSVCLNKHGKARRRVNVTLAHRDHIHFGLSKAGAAAKTSFWDR
jgi:hypothetical protein